VKEARKAGWKTKVDGQFTQKLLDFQIEQATLGALAYKVKKQFSNFGSIISIRNKKRTILRFL